jgi:hypothetical protein
MAIILGNNPKDFVRPVEIIKFGGVKDSISFTFTYRNKREFAALVDERAAISRAKLAAKEAEQKAITDAGGEAPPYSVMDDYLAFTREQAENVLQIATKWDLKDDLTVENLQLLEDEFPGSLEAIQVTYRSAIADVRVKN